MSDAGDSPVGSFNHERVFFSAVHADGTCRAEVAIAMNEAIDNNGTDRSDVEMMVLLDDEKDPFVDRAEATSFASGVMFAQLKVEEIRYGKSPAVAL